MSATKNNQEILELAQRLEKLTAVNLHTEALIVLARFLKENSAAAIFQNILNIQTLEGHLPDYLSSYKYQKYQLLMQYAKSELSPENYFLIYNAL